MFVAFFLGKGILPSVKMSGPVKTVIYTLIFYFSCINKIVININNILMCLRIISNPNFLHHCCLNWNNESTSLISCCEDVIYF